ELHRVLGGLRPGEHVRRRRGNGRKTAPPAGRQVGGSTTGGAGSEVPDPPVVEWGRPRPVHGGRWTGHHALCELWAYRKPRGGTSGRRIGETPGAGRPDQLVPGFPRRRACRPAD